MSSVQNINSISFRSNYLIPYSEINKADSETMRQVGTATAKYATTPDSMMQTKEGIAVAVPDSKDKEYEAIIAKYGLNIQKYNGKIVPQGDPTEHSYSFMVSKIDPQNAEKRINAYKSIKDDKEKGMEYMLVYQEFKNSPHSVEHQQSLKSPDLKPTGTPIIKYTTKDGEKMMAREVVLGNGYKCVAVSNEKNPNEATLMNKEEFKKFFIESVEQKESKSSKEVKKAVGQFADKNFEVGCKQGLSNRSLSGKVDDLNFNIKHNGKVFKADEITGNIGDKKLDIKMSDSFAKRNLKGTLGDEPIDLTVSRTFSGYSIKGQFKDKKLDIDIENKWNGFAIKSDKMDLRVKNKSMFGNDVKVKGTYNEDKDLIPLLMDMAYALNDEELELLMLVMLL